jgi:DNA-binding transcriptional LysR family regulator
MDRLRRVSNLWSWLPAFRAVAETQHLPTASTQLFVSASALSRTIRLLEEDVGRRLFLRSGRRIELNEAGQRLLVAVRDAMRMIHEGLLAMDGKELRGPVLVGTAGLVTTAYVLPALRRLQREHPDLVPHVLDRDDREVGEQLLAGELDVAFVTRPPADAQLAKVHLGTAPSGIYCGPGHPLHGAHEVSVPQVLAHPFVALAPDDRGLSLEGWPAALDRRVSLWVSQLATGLEACAAGELLAVLPDAVGRSPAHQGRLHRLPLEVIPPADLFAIHRTTLGEGGRAEAVVHAVVQALAVAGGL